MLDLKHILKIVVYSSLGSFVTQIPASAESYVEDRFTGAKIWTEEDDPSSLQVSWSGPSVNGYASGYGVITIDLIKSTQRSLLILGYYTGPIDGLMKPAMHDIIRRYQGDKNLVVDGQPSEALLNNLQANGGKRLVAEIS
jgi:hypothetical protein